MSFTTHSERSPTNTPTGIPDEVRLALADHFWCDLLAQVAHAVDRGLQAVSDIPDRIADLILRSRTAGKWRPIAEKVIRLACRSVWRQIQLTAFFTVLGPSRQVLLAIRLLAVLICKAPERHRAVVEYCLDPLTNQLREETRHRLVGVLAGWLPKLGGPSGQVA
jgi:hypothetical protein